MKKANLSLEFINIANVIGNYIKTECLGNSKAKTRKEICENLSRSLQITTESRLVFQKFSPAKFRNCINYLRNEKEGFAAICSLSTSAGYNSKKCGYFWAQTHLELRQHNERLVNRLKEQHKTIKNTQKTYELMFKRPLDCPAFDTQVTIGDVEIAEKFKELFAGLMEIQKTMKPDKEAYKKARQAVMKFIIQHPPKK
jgi:hypothetical protein